MYMNNLSHLKSTRQQSDLVPEISCQPEGVITHQNPPLELSQLQGPEIIPLTGVLELLRASGQPPALHGRDTADHQREFQGAGYSAPPSWSQAPEGDLDIFEEGMV